jgi:hypothetical protein
VSEYLAVVQEILMTNQPAVLVRVQRGGRTVLECMVLLSLGTRDEAFAVARRAALGAYPDVEVRAPWTEAN